ncbi:MAG: AAA family ATPase [Gaiella sp.]
MLLGRTEELATVRDACGAAVAGHGSVLVVAGEPGIGKTSLLVAAAESSSDWDVVRTTCVEVESAVAFTTLQALVWPLRDHLDEIGATQAELLRGILEVGPALEASTFTIGAATLALFSVVGSTRPLVVLVDDIQWADPASQEALCFVGRRLGWEHVALLVGQRSGEPSLFADERSFPRLELGQLDAGTARSLLERSGSGKLAPGVIEPILDACGGNPLGLVELPFILTEAQRQGLEPLPTPLEAGPIVRRAFAARASLLSAEGRRAIVLLAAGGEAPLSLLSTLGVRAEALAELDASGLVARHAETMRFRHPLVRAAVFSEASPFEQRGAHNALAEHSKGARRAWHLAAAATGADESVAEALEGAAVDARLIGGFAAQAQALERAGELTADDDVKARRLHAAARAWRRAGQIDKCRPLLDTALDVATTVESRGRIQLEHGSMLIRQGEIDLPCELLLAEATRAEQTHPKLAAQMIAESALALDVKPDIPQAIALAERARTLAGSDGDRPELEAVNALLTARTSAGLPPTSLDSSLVLRAAELLEDSELRIGAEEPPWIAYCLMLHEHDDHARRLSDRSLAEARAAGDVWSLCVGLYARAAIEQATGRVDAAHTWASEAVQLAEQIEEPWRIAEAYGVLAEAEMGRGDVDAARNALLAKEEHFRPVRPDLNQLYRDSSLGTACVACGRFEEAVSLLERAEQATGVTLARAWYHLRTLELAEAYHMVGRRRAAEHLIKTAAGGIEDGMIVRPKVKLARVRALLAAEADIDRAFTAVLGLLEEKPHHLEHARAELGWGESLRRAGRSADSAIHVRHALAGFEAIGATGWTERAQRELEAATGSARTVTARRTSELTPQELRVATHAAGGVRDREIAARLYLSPRTVESYLHSTYRKLGIGNRTQLAAVLAADGIRPPAAPQDP